MATFTKKLYMKNSAGTQQTANIYSTTGEVGSNYMYVIVDGTQGYIGLVDTSNSSATSGRVLKNGTTYAIASATVPAYSKQLITSGSGTFTVPTGATKLKVTCVGGGAGCFVYACSHHCSYDGAFTGSGTYSSGAGGASTFGSVTAYGATSTVVVVSKKSCSCGSGRDDTCTSYAPSYSSFSVSSGSINGVKYTGCGYKSGTAGQSITAYDGTVYGPYGKGGGGAGDGNNDTVCAITGGSGYVTVSTINVTPGQALSYTVGGGGSGATDWYAGYYCEAGTSGAILVEWGKGIQ